MSSFLVSINTCCPGWCEFHDIVFTQPAHNLPLPTKFVDKYASSSWLQITLKYNNCHVCAIRKLSWWRGYQIILYTKLTYGITCATLSRYSFVNKKVYSWQSASLIITSAIEPHQLNSQMCFDYQTSGNWPLNLRDSSRSPKNMQVFQRLGVLLLTQRGGSAELEWQSLTMQRNDLRFPSYGCWGIQTAMWTICSGNL